MPQYRPGASDTFANARPWAWLALAALVYVFAHHLAYAFPDSEEMLMVIWPAGGVGLSAFLITPRRHWPRLALVLFAAGSAANLLAGRHPAASAAFMAVNVLESAACAILIQRVSGPLVAFRRVSDVIALVASATVVNAVTALAGAQTAMHFSDADFVRFWFTWWTSDGLGILLVTPFLITWLRPDEGRAGSREARTLEGCIFLLIWCLLAWCFFNPGYVFTLPVLPSPYLLGALLIWPALRLGLRPTTTALVLLAGISLTSVSVQRGPLLWGGETVEERLLLAQLFLASVASTGLLLAATYAQSRAAERLARNEKARLQAVGDNLPAGAVFQAEHTPDGRLALRYVSAGIERITGLSPATVLQDLDRFFEGLPPEDRSRIMKAARGGANSGAAVELTAPYQVPGGEVRWLHIAASPHTLDDGAPGWDGILTDITGAVLAERALRESEERFKLSMEATSDGIWDWDVRTDEGYFSPSYYRMLGYEPGEFKSAGASWLERIHPADRDRALRANLDCVEGLCDAFEVEYRMRARDGSWRWILGRGKCVARDDGGRAIRLVGTHLDLTERKRVEEENGRLQDQLAHAQRLESIGRLAGGVAHDFNNMLGVILGHAELALSSLDTNDTLAADLNEICKAATRSADLTRQLLTFARKQTIVPRAIDLNSTVESMLKMLRRLVGENIQIHWIPGGPIWQVKMDPSQVDQILANLCVNARDAIAENGNITIQTENFTCTPESLEAYPDFQPGDYVRIVFSDDGCGMDKETMARIFDPFFTTKSMAKGTGLGLATVHGAVMQNRGFIHVYSEPGQGATFHIYLPRHISAAATGEDRPKPEAAPRGRETILVVEDEPGILKMTSRLLELQGYTVIEAESAEIALSIAGESSAPIDLLLTDVIMPGMNGHDLAIKLMEARPDMKCLFMSGYTANVIAHHGVLDEHQHFIQKPFSKYDLADTVRAVLDTP